MRKKLRRFRVWCVVLTLLTLPRIAAGSEAKDAEAATHSDQAATYQLVDTYDFPGFKLAQYDLAVLSHYSYMLYSGGECLVVDPGRDIGAYVEAAKNEKSKIIGVWLTHSHADFVAGHIEFAKLLAVPLRISQLANAGYEHIAVSENDALTIGDAVIKFLATPGHTPDSMCGVVSSKSDPEKPLALLTGDTLFVGSVGRPDLLGEGMTASTLASMMFDTWTNKLSKLPDEVMILPAHGAGSLCGAHLSDEPTSTIGRQRVSNAYLQYKNRGEFVAAILDGLPEAPQYFAHNAAINRQGPEPVAWTMESLPLVTPSTELTDPSKYYVIDVREAQQYADGHIPNSVNIALRGRFETWTGIMVPWDAHGVVVGDENQLRMAVHRLNRVGYQPQCIFFDSWQRAGLPITKNQMISPREFYGAMQTSEAPVVVDVRLPSEWMALRIGTVLNIPLNKLSAGLVKLDKSQRIVAVCNSAYRSSLAVGILERAGFQHASSMAGGGEAWVKAGLPVYEATAQGRATAVTPKRVVRLAERISASELKLMLIDLPGMFQLVDIRPADHFADYHVPGSENVDLAELIGNAAHLTGAGPLVIVDRDGTLAMMVAGILSQKTERPIKVLSGGLQAYWNEVGLGASARSLSLESAPAGATPQSASPAAPAATEPPANKPKKRRSQGCEGLTTRS